jgi:hypothetical protein
MDCWFDWNVTCDVRQLSSLNASWQRLALCYLQLVLGNYCCISDCMSGLARYQNTLSISSYRMRITFRALAFTTRLFTNSLNVFKYVWFYSSEGMLSDVAVHLITNPQRAVQRFDIVSTKYCVHRRGHAKKIQVTKSVVYKKCLGKQNSNRVTRTQESVRWEPH